jgi:hypothetical protein
VGERPPYLELSIFTVGSQRGGASFAGQSVFEKFFALNAITTSWIIVADDSIATPLSRKTPPTRKLSALKALQRSAKGQEARARRACRHLRKPNIRWAAILPAALFVSLHLCRFRQKSPPLSRF